MSAQVQPDNYPKNERLSLAVKSYFSAFSRQVPNWAATESDDERLASMIEEAVASGNPLPEKQPATKD